MPTLFLWFTDEIIVKSKLCIGGGKRCIKRGKSKSKTSKTHKWYAFFSCPILPL